MVKRHSAKKKKKKVKLHEKNYQPKQKNGEKNGQDNAKLYVVFRLFFPFFFPPKKKTPISVLLIEAILFALRLFLSPQQRTRLSLGEIKQYR